MTTSDSSSENAGSSTVLPGTPPLPRLFPCAGCSGLGASVCLCCWKPSGSAAISRSLWPKLLPPTRLCCKPSICGLALHLLNQGADPVALRLRYADTSYAGQPLTVDQALSLARKPA